ncbi:MAG: pyridoxal-phosphate-dependent aminotransferase family protein, partial [Myxococcota bacterium]
MKYRLLSPGPTPVPETVLTAMANPMWHHRTPAFEKIFAECREGLRWLFQVDDDVLILSSSGTGGFEAAIQTYFSVGDNVNCDGGGKFGERWGQMARKLGLEAIDIPVEWGEAADPGKVEEALKAHPDAKGVVVVASETSTGVRHPYEAIGALVKDREDTLFLVDGITAVGVWDINPKRDHIDVLVSGSQKAFMLPPGLAFVASSEKAWRRASQAKGPRYYFDLNKEKKNQAQNQTAYTPAVSLIVGLQESLRLLREEGLEQIFARHARLARATRVGCEALGLSLFAKVPAESVTSVVSPSEIPPDAVYKGLRDRANITIAGGQDALKGKIFRVAHLGYYDDLDIMPVMGASVAVE